MRIEHHPILGSAGEKKRVSFSFDGELYQGVEGEPVAAALYAAGIRTHSYSHKTQHPRGIFCMIGKCTDCVMIINGKPNIRTCVTPLQDGMKIYTQYGNGAKRADE